MLDLVTGTHLDLAHSDARHGIGLFETLRIEEGRVLRLERHLARMAQGAVFLEISEPPPSRDVLAFVRKHTELDRLATGVLRLFAVDGKLMVSASAMDLHSQAPVDVAVSLGLVRFRDSPLNRFKTLSYLENVLLAREAERLGVFDVLALNECGQLTDGSRTNVFLVRRGKLLTPYLSCGALPGVLRGLIVEAGLATNAELTMDDLRSAEAVILCNSLRELIPVRHISGMGDMDPEPDVLARMREVVFDSKR